MLKQKIKIFLFVLFLAAFAQVPRAANAAGLVPCGGYGESPCNITHVFYMAALVTNWLMAVAGLYAVYQLVNAGFWMVVTQGNEESITKYKSMATNAVLGFCLVMFAYLFVNTAVNFILSSHCKVNLTSPMDYVLKPCELKSNESQVNPNYNTLQQDLKDTTK